MERRRGDRGEDRKYLDILTEEGATHTQGRMNPGNSKS